MQRKHLIAPRGLRTAGSAALLALLAALVAPPVVTAQAPTEATASDATAEETATTEPEAPRSTLDRVRVTGRLVIAYQPDVRPLSYRDESGKAAGWTVELCRLVADAVKAELHLGSLDVQWLPVASAQGMAAVHEGRADLLCAARETLTAREQVAFSIPVFPAGVGALVRADAPERLREVLDQRTPQSRPLWRGSTSALEQRTFAVVAGSPVADWLAARIDTFRLIATVTTVSNVDEGIRQVLDGKADVFFGERNVLLDAASRSRGADSLHVTPRQYTVDPVAIGLARGDEDLRLVVDRALSGLFRSEGFTSLFTQWFGPPDQNMQLYFRASALSEK